MTICIERESDQEQQGPDLAVGEDQHAAYPTGPGLHEMEMLENGRRSSIYYLEQLQ